MRRAMALLLAGALLGMGVAYAYTTSKNVVIKAQIPSQEGLSVAISRIDKNNNWHTVDEIFFNSLHYNSDYGIFLSDDYYAVDVGVLSNAADWTLSYSATSVVGPNNYKLDKHINVTFVKQMGDNEAQELAKATYADALGPLSLNKADLQGGWLRIYYGIATGDQQTDAPGAEPITTDVPAGLYSGTITLTLTTQ